MFDLDFKGLNILVIGDVMIDRYIYGKVDRISPEAPIPIVNKSNEENKLGGAANVALNIMALGANPYLIGVIGEDTDGKFINALLVQERIINSKMIIDNSRRSTVKTRIISHGQHLLRVDSEDTHDISEDIQYQIISHLKDFLADHQIDAIVLQDYNKGVLTSDLISRIISIANEAGTVTIVDPKIKNFFAYKGATLIKPNKLELELASGNTFTISDLKKGLITRKIKNYLKCRGLFVTLSEDGIFYHIEERHNHVPTIRRDIIDVCGAGDTVLAVLACGYAKKLEPDVLSHMANIAGGQVCEVSGVVTVKLDDLKEELAQTISASFPSTP